LTSFSHSIFNLLDSLQTNDSVGEYQYALSLQSPLLHASVYSAMIRHLIGGYNHLSKFNTSKWISYIKNFQCSDGLYREDILKNEISETEDWWGWRHLSAHVITALIALSGETSLPFNFLEFLYEPGQATKWIASLPWATKAHFVSNTMMNYGILLQYNRDFWNIKEAGDALREVFDWLDNVQDPATGC